MKTPLTPINQNVINKNTQTYNLTIIWILDLYSFKKFTSLKNLEYIIFCWVPKIEYFLLKKILGQYRTRKINNNVLPSRFQV